MHVNQQAREAAKTRIETTSVASVWTNRGANLRDGLLPAAVIGTAFDEAESATKGLDEQERRSLTMTVAVVLDGASDTVDDDADAIRAEIEAVLADDLGGLAKRMQHTGGELEMLGDEEGHEWYAVLVLSWDVEIWTTRGNPEEAT